MLRPLLAALCLAPGCGSTRKAAQVPRLPRALGQRLGGTAPAAPRPVPAAADPAQQARNLSAWLREESR